MMVLQIHFTPDEIRQFFLENGYTVIEQAYGRWETRHGSAQEWVTYMADSVVVDNKSVRADKLFERIAEHRIKSMLAPRNYVTQQIILQQFNRLSKGN
jgi:hypothetical protein